MIPLVGCAGLILATLSNQGHWFGGEEASIEFRWNAPADANDILINWELRLTEVQLVRGQTLLPCNEPCSRIALAPPTVRTRTEMRFGYRALDPFSGVELDSGKLSVHVYPDDSLAGLPERLARTKLAICGDQGLSERLRRAAIPHRCVTSPSELALSGADIVLASVDRIAGSPFAEGALLKLAAHGCSVMVYPVEEAGKTSSFRHGDSDRGTNWELRTDHPLLFDFEREDLLSWCRNAAGDLRVFALDQPVTPVVYRSPESPPDERAVVDLLLAVRRVGAGRIVLCRLPVQWRDDPRSVLLLRNALNYLITPAEPTSSAREGSDAPLRRQPASPEIPVFPGALP